MENINGLARLLIIAGLALAAVGGLLVLAGKLPGDIVIKRGSATIFFPIVTFLLISLIITIVVNIVLRIMNR